MAIISILALLVMMAATGGMFREFLQINKDSKEFQGKCDQMLNRGDQLLAKFDQLVTLLTVINAIAEEPPLRRRTTKRRRPVTAVLKPATNATTDKSDSTTTEPKGGTDGDKKTSPAN